MQLGDAETGLLEDCYEDWRGLWELTWGDDGRTPDECVAFLRPLVEAGYLTTLRLKDWNEAVSAEPMPASDALNVVNDLKSYVPPEGGDTFYVLSITKKGEEAIPFGTFPDM